MDLMGGAWETAAGASRRRQHPASQGPAAPWYPGVRATFTMGPAPRAQSQGPAAVRRGRCGHHPVPGGLPRPGRGLRGSGVRGPGSWGTRQCPGGALLLPLPRLLPATQPFPGSDQGSARSHKPGPSPRQGWPWHAGCTRSYRTPVMLLAHQAAPGILLLQALRPWATAPGPPHGCCHHAADAAGREQHLPAAGHLRVLSCLPSAGLPARSGGSGSPAARHPLCCSGASGQGHRRRCLGWRGSWGERPPPAYGLVQPPLPQLPVGSHADTGETSSFWPQPQQPLQTLVLLARPGHTLTLVTTKQGGNLLGDELCPSPIFTCPSSLPLLPCLPLATACSPKVAPPQTSSRFRG
ncbi:unnamed protein product [Lepidochelys kempii]